MKNLIALVSVALFFPFLYVLKNRLRVVIELRGMRIANAANFINPRASQRTSRWNSEMC